MAGGALGALAFGGDPLIGAASAGIAIGVNIVCQINPAAQSIGTGLAETTGDRFISELIMSAGVGALAGGVTAEIFGGDFSEGAAYGAASSAATYAMEGFLKAGETDSISPP